MVWTSFVLLVVHSKSISSLTPLCVRSQRLGESARCSPRTRRAPKPLRGNEAHHGDERRDDSGDPDRLDARLDRPIQDVARRRHARAAAVLGEGQHERVVLHEGRVGRVDWVRGSRAGVSEARGGRGARGTDGRTLVEGPVVLARVAVPRRVVPLDARVVGKGVLRAGDPCVSALYPGSACGTAIVSNDRTGCPRASGRTHVGAAAHGHGGAEALAVAPLRVATPEAAGPRGAISILGAARRRLRALARPAARDRGRVRPRAAAAGGGLGGDEVRGGGEGEGVGREAGEAEWARGAGGEGPGLGGGGGARGRDEGQGDRRERDDAGERRVAVEGCTNASVVPRDASRARRLTAHACCKARTGPVGSSGDEEGRADAGEGARIKWIEVGRVDHGPPCTEGCG